MRLLVSKYFGIFLFFFVIAFGLGYSTLNRFNPLEAPGLADVAVYGGIVMNGANEQSYGISDKRLLVPYIARFLYSHLPHFANWNPVSLALLLTNSIFVSLSALLMIEITYLFFQESSTALLAGFLFITNFFVTNSYLVGSVDAAYAFFFLLLYYLLFKDKWSGLPLIMVVGCLTKEVFLPVAGASVFCILIHQAFSLKKVPLARSCLFLIMIIFGLGTLFGVHFYIYGSYENLLSSTNFVFSPLGGFEFSTFATQLGGDLLKFFVTVGVLILIGLYSFQKYPIWFLAGNLGALLMILFLTFIARLANINEFNGVDIARFIFSPAALLICGSSAMALSKLNLQRSKLF